MNRNERLPLNSDLLRSFVTIAESGNLTVAAGRLHRTQSAISVQLRNLEADLGVTLFARTPKGMVLTDEGDRLLPKAKSILSALKDASALFETPLTGRIRIGIPDDFDDTVLEGTLVDFSRRHPGVDVVATSGCTSGFPAAIRNGTLDLAVYSGPENDTGETLAVETTVWAAGRTARLATNAPVPLAILDRGCWWRDLPVKALEGQGRDYTVAFKSASFGSLRAAIRAGFAVGVLPQSCVTESVRVLSKAEGFPSLPKSRRSILIRPGAAQELTSAMADAIRNGRTERLTV